jgi:phage shock protein C
METNFNSHEQQIPKRMTRKQDGRKIAGVCAGVAAYFNLDPTIIRLIWVALVLACGTGILFYLIAWIVMPLDEQTRISI